jgi:methylase of polypeptide subunit release factors
VRRDALARDLDVDALQDAGLLAEEGDGRLRAVVRMTPFDGLLLMHDPSDARGRTDQVIAVGPASRTLARLTVRRPAGRALDLGTGCGIQALLAARHCATVIGTDVNERALAMARSNARLNGIDNVEFVNGSLFDPVAGETFDLVVANPPFVVSPDTSHVYRDSGLSGDEISRAVVTGLPDHLAPHGHATVLCEWLRREGDAWYDAPLAWLQGRPCDVLALHYRTGDPETYATGWNMGLRDADPDEFLTTVDRWIAYQRALGASGVATGALVLRRREEGTPWSRAEEMPGGPSGPASAQLLRLFAGVDALASLSSEDALLAASLTLAPGQTLGQLISHAAGGWRAEDARLSADEGAGVFVTVPAPAVHLLLQLRPGIPLGAAVDEAAAQLGLDPAELSAVALPVVRRLVEAGLATIEPSA